MGELIANYVDHTCRVTTDQYIISIHD